MSHLMIGAIGTFLMVLLLVSQIPIGIVMALVGFLGFACFVSPGASLEMVASTGYGTMADYGLTVIPLFILMGEFAFNSGISRDLYITSYKWMGRIPGGLAIATIWACAGFAAVCGSSVAAAATMGTVTIPEMAKYNYAPSLRTACVAAGGTLGILIPPSVGFILYGILTNVSIGKLFIAGIIPGLILAILFTISIYIQVRIDPSLAPISTEKVSFVEKLSSLKGSIDMFIIFLLVMGGLFVGVFTPTEAGAIGAFITLILSLVRRRIKLKGITESLLDTALTTGMVFLITIGAMIFSRFLALSTLPTAVANWAANLPLDPIIILIIILFLYVILGCILDTLAMILLTIPIFFPVITTLGFDPILFGVLVVIMAELGLITPPVGMNVFVIAGVAKDVPLNTIFKGIYPFVTAMAVLIALIIIFPSLVTFLPNFMK